MNEIEEEMKIVGACQNTRIRRYGSKIVMTANSLAMRSIFGNSSSRKSYSSLKKL